MENYENDENYANIDEEFEAHCLKEIEHLKEEINHGQDLSKNYFGLFFNYKHLKDSDKKYKQIIETYLKKAIELALREVSENNYEATTLINLGLAYEYYKNDEKSLYFYNLAVEKFPDADDVYLSRGSYYLKKRKKVEYKKDFDKAIELNPENAEFVKTITLAEDCLLGKSIFMIRMYEFVLLLAIIYYIYVALAPIIERFLAK